MASVEKDVVKIGIVGCGSISGYHVDALRLVPEAKILAYCDLDIEKAKKVARNSGYCCTDYHKILEDKEIDLVFVLTPNDLHCPMVIDACEAGKDVVVQKPMARSVQECNEMIQAAESNGVRIFQSFMHRYVEECQWAKGFIAQGKLGRVLDARIRNAIPGSDYSIWQYSAERCGEGGVMRDIGPHGIDLVRYILGDIETVLTSFAEQRLHERLIDGETIFPDNEDYAVGLYRLKSGALVSHEMSWAQQTNCNRFWFEIHGTEGDMFLRSGYGPVVVSSKGFGDGMYSPKLGSRPFGLRQHQEIIDCERYGLPPVCGAEDGRKAVALVDELVRHTRRLDSRK